MRRCEADLHRQLAVEIERADCRIAQINDAKVGARQSVAEIADRRGFADADVGDQDSQPGFLAEHLEARFELRIARGFEEALPVSVLREHVVGETESLQVVHGLLLILILVFLILVLVVVVRHDRNIFWTALDRDGKLTRDK